MESHDYVCLVTREEIKSYNTVMCVLSLVDQLSYLLWLQQLLHVCHMTDKESHMMHTYMVFATLLEIYVSEMSSMATTIVTPFFFIHLECGV